MPRLRIRKPNNNDWLDICQSEWYVRNAANTAWVRITPAQGLKVRHGTNNYWLNIDCLSEDCGPDIYGGTEDGKGLNNTGPTVDQNKPTDFSYPGETDGGTINPWDPTTYPNTNNPSTGGPITTPPNNGNNSPSNPDYTNPNVDSSDEGTGDPACANGTYSNGTYPPGYDLPDACGPNAGIVENPDGTTDIYRPGTDTKESYDDENGSGTDDSAGTKDDPYGCPTTVNSNGKQVTEFYADIGTVSGQIDIEYDAHTGASGFTIYHAGQKVAESAGHVFGAGRLSFNYDSSKNDTRVMIRVRTDSNANEWSVRIPCPGEKEEIGTLTNPASCLGNFSPKAGTGRITEIVHDMGSTAGQVVVEYNMFNIADSLDVWYGNTRLATTGVVTGTGSLNFMFTPSGTNTKITIRITSSSTDTSWAYNITCPGATGSKLTPKACDPDNAVQSGGSGVTDIYFDLGTDPGQVKLRYNAFNLPDNFEIYQGQTLIASAANVTGEGQVLFMYNPNAGDVRVRVSGSGQTTWAFLVECPTPPATTIGCSTPFEDLGYSQTIVTLTGANGAYSLVEYATVPDNTSPPNGTASTISVDYNGSTIENTGNVKRWKTHGRGALVVPLVSGVNSLAVSRDANAPYWYHTTYCPTVWPAVFGMTKFNQGFDHAYEDGAYYTNVWYGSRKIGISSGLTMKGYSCAILMSMVHITNGALTITGAADDYAGLYLVGAGNPVLLGEFNSTLNTVTATVAPGTYFLVAMLENITPNASPAWFASVVLDGSIAVSVTSKDWYGGYFEKTGTYNAGNLPIIPTGSAKIYDTDGEATTYMNANVAPSVQSIFNTWPRIDGANYYANQGSAAGAAAAWSFASSPDRFVQAQNTTAPNMIVSPTAYANYTLEAKITSNDSDNDANGIVLAFNKTGNVLSALVVSRTCNGSFAQPTAKGMGLVLIVNGGETLKMQVDQGIWPNGWNGAYTRVHAERTGNIIKFKATDYNSDTFGPEYTVDLTSDPAYAPFLSSAALGFYTYSQANTSFSEVIIPGLDVNESVYSAATNTIWTATNGVWANQGSGLAFSTKLPPYTYVTNPATNNSYHIYKTIQRKAP